MASERSMPIGRACVSRTRCARCTPRSRTRKSTASSTTSEAAAVSTKLTRSSNFTAPQTTTAVASQKPTTCINSTIVSALQKEFGTALQPPAEAADWSAFLLRRWFVDGGTITIESATQLFERFGKSHLQYVGIGLPVQPLAAPTLAVPGGLLGASERGERRTFDMLGMQLANRGFALVDLGEPSDGGAPSTRAFYAAACDEGRRLWPHMRAGELTDKDGKLSSGEDPSGDFRGDRFVDCSDAYAAGAWPALRALDTALALVGVELNTSLRNVLAMRSDPYFACFPGGGTRYGAHFDGGAFNATCKITTIVYTNAEWDGARDGGCLHLFDEAHRVWHAIEPRAGRLVLFRADTVLHRVEPTRRTRHALTAWWYVGVDGKPGAEGAMMLAREKSQRTEAYTRADGGRAARDVRKAMAHAVT